MEISKPVALNNNSVRCQISCYMKDTKEQLMTDFSPVNKIEMLRDTRDGASY